MIKQWDILVCRIWFLSTCLVREEPSMMYEESCRVDLQHNTFPFSLEPTVNKTNATLLMLLGFGGLSVVLAFLHNAVRKYVYQDSHNLDTTFDAGGRVTFSLTVVTVTSQLLWPTAYLQIPTMVIKCGLGGAVLAISFLAVMVLFPIMSLNLKTRAPGAKTYLQMVHARFGRPAHVVFCVVALLANCITMISLILAGKTAIDTITGNSSDEYVVIILTVLFGSYCFIGGIGTTFYISYFNTAITFITLLVFIGKLNYSDDKDSFLSMESMYEASQCIEGPDGNQEESLLTFRSRSSIIYASVLFFTTFSISACDQATWQSRIAARPIQGVFGFFVAAFLWIVIPTSLSLTASLSYLSMSYKNGSHLLSGVDIDKGYVLPFMVSQTMGTAGGYLLLTMLAMAWMSTGSGEVMAISSIIVYDIYKLYINPFRKLKTATSCPLCGEDKVQDISGERKAETTPLCSCITADDCEDCGKDIEMLLSNERLFGIQYKCLLHGKFRHYEDLLVRYKNWCILWITIAIIPFGFFIIKTDINLNWTVFFLNTLLSAFLVPLLLTLAWSKTTSAGVICGTISGVLSVIVGILTVAATVYPTGLDDFLTNTAAEYSVMVGALSGVTISSTVTIIVSLATTKVHTSVDSEIEWNKTLSIDNPLNPWRRLYQSQLITISNPTKITSSHLSLIFKKARWAACVCGAIGTVLCVIIAPTSLLSISVLTFDQFYGFIICFQVFCFLGATFAVIAPPIEEIVQIWKHLKIKRAVQYQKRLVRLNKESDMKVLDTQNTQI